MSKSLRCRAIYAGAVALVLSATAMATQPPDTGLGQAWPNVQDMSSSTRWHVYVFNSDGVEFVQINDLNGNVRGAFAAVGGQFIVLPMGRDARRVSTPQQQAERSRTAVPLQAYSEIVYRDSSIELTAVPMSDGTIAFNALASKASTAKAACDPDKEDCNTHMTTTMSSLAAAACDPDKEDCNTHINKKTTSTFAAPSCNPDKEDCNTHMATTMSTLAASACDPDKEDCNTHISKKTTSTFAAPSCNPDKEDCNTHMTTTMSTLAASACDPDKEDCNTHRN